MLGSGSYRIWGLFTASREQGNMQNLSRKQGDMAKTNRELNSKKAFWQTSKPSLSSKCSNSARKITIIDEGVCCLKIKKLVSASTLIL